MNATPEPDYDLLIKGGTVIDPSQRVNGLYDVAIVGSKIAKVAPDLPETSARRIVSAEGRVVTPGLVDIHVHVYDAHTPIGVPPDPNLVAKGVTTAVDAGSSGAHTFPGFRKYIVNLVDTRIYALLNVSTLGLVPLSSETQRCELRELNEINPKLAVRTIEQNRDVILGVKIRLTPQVEGDQDVEALRLAREIADAVGLPLMVHYVARPFPIKSILDGLEAGDVLTHCFHGWQNGVLDEDGKVKPEVLKAVDRGIRLDVGHGEGSFAWSVAERALAQELRPGTISSDLHHYNVEGPVYDLATTLSKFLHLGMTLEEVIQLATANPAQVFGFPEGLGSLAEGAEADVAVFELAEGDFDFVDGQKERRIGHQKLIPSFTIKGGHIHGGGTRYGVDL